MLRRKTMFTLTLAEAAVLWLTTIAGVAFVEGHHAGAPDDLPRVLGRSLAFAVTCVVSLWVADLYDVAKLRRATSFAERLPCALGVALCLLALLYGLAPHWRDRPLALLPSTAVAMVLLFVMRVALGRVIRRERPERVLVLGDRKLARKIIEVVDAKRGEDHVGEHVVAGVVPLLDDGATVNARLGDAVRSTDPDRIVVATTDRRVPLPLRQLLDDRLHGIAVEDWVPFYERLAGKIAVESLTPDNVAFGDGFGEARVHAAFARALGVVAALLGLIALAPLLLAVCIAIRLTSPGPVFFVQQRVGCRGRPYGLLKLRTMHSTDHPRSEWAEDNKHRITPLGRWLRRFRIDELPQLINVLKGDMNLVGPRPHPVSNYLAFMEQIPYYALRSVVRPGITGWAQVRYGYANNLEQEIEKMRFDLYYIRNVSIWLDIRVLLETVRVVLRGQETIDKPARPTERARALRAQHSRTLT